MRQRQCGDATDQRQRHRAQHDQAQPQRAVACVEQGQHQQQRQQGQAGDAPGGGGLRLVFPFQAQFIARRQRQVRQCILGGTRGQVEAAGARIGRHGDAAAQVLAQDLARTIAALDVAEPAQRHRAGGSVDRNVAEHGGTQRVLRQAQHQIEAFFAFDDARQRIADGELAQRLLHPRRRDAVLRSAARIDADLHLRRLGLRLRLHVGEAGDALEPVHHLVGQAAQHGQILAIELHRQRCAHTGEQVIEPVRDGLAEDQRRRQRAHARAQIRHHLGTRPAIGAQGEFEFGIVQALGVLVLLGAAGAAADAGHLGHIQRQFLRRGADLVCGLQRNARPQQQVYGQAAFIERRQKAARQTGCENAGAGQQEQRK